MAEERPRSSLSEGLSPQLLALPALCTDNMVVIADAKGRILWVNHAFTHITGYSLEEVRGRKPGHILQGPETDQETVAFMRERLKLGQGFRAELLNYTKDKRKFWTSISVQPVFDEQGKLCNYISVESDATERKRMEARLARAHEQALQAARVKSQFLTNMSHELRTPMNGVLGMTELLLGTELDSEQREFAETARKSAERLLSIIDDILDLSKMEADRLEMEMVGFDLRETVDEVVGLLSNRAQAKGLEVISHVPGTLAQPLIGDPVRLRQILTNLLGNAIKFTEEGEIFVGAELLRKRRGTLFVRLSVRDTGIGIPLSRQRAIFESFIQADGTTSRRFGGTGLGLTISKQLAELMGGSIHLKSNENQGSTFWLDLPLGLVAERRELPNGSAALSPLGEGLRVLVVDDHPTARKVLGMQLEELGIEVSSASNAEEALEHLRKAQPASPHLVLIDHHMPGVGGIELASAIKAESQLQDIPLVLMSVGGPGGLLPREKRFLFAARLHKPVGFSRLADLFKRVLDQSQGEKEGENGSFQCGIHHPLRILLAEDNEINQAVARKILRNAGYRVDVVPDGKQAVTAVTATPYDVVLMDIQMPGMDGIEATREIRRLEGRGPQLPIVALTAHTHGNDRVRCLRAGMNGYLQKPIRPQELLTLLDGLLPPDRVPASTSENHAGNGEKGKEGVFDLTRLHEVCGDDTELERSLIEEFLKSVDSRFEHIDHSVSVQFTKVVETEAHSLRGSCLTLGAFSLAEAVEAVEKNAREQDLKAIERARPRMDFERMRVRAFLRERLMALSGD